MKSEKNEKNIATIVHISDLHFRNKFTTDESRFKKLLANLPLLKGTYAHSYQAARSLANRVNKILKDKKQNRVPVGVVFTGDLTSSGEEGEFQVGTTFLRGSIWTGTGQVGLNLGEDRSEIEFNSTPVLFSIPGNHDIWKRNHPDKLAAYLNFFPGPFPKIWKIETQSRTIFLHGLDSNQNTLLKHKLARGRLRHEQLDELDNRLEMLRMSQIGKDPIHIVFLHHPLIVAGEKSWDPTMELDDCQIIAKRLKQSGVDLVLSGHVHQEFYVSEEWDMPHHAIAGTATQMFSDRNFLLLDIYDRKICLQVYEYSKETLQFVPNEDKKHIFTLPLPESSPAPIQAKVQRDKWDLEQLISSIKRKVKNES